jgi:hypothetical protein
VRFLVSGEGPTDIGRCQGSEPCSADSFETGPMAWLVDQVAEHKLRFSSIPLHLMHALSKSVLQAETKRIRPPSLRGKRRPDHETAYFFRNARALARTAQRLAKETEDEVVAVLFRDADRTQSTRHDDWRVKQKSMLDGFDVEEFETGVPMVPNPKSEAWLLCALKHNQPYQHCNTLEKESGNDNAPRSLKSQLEHALGEKPTRELLSKMVQTRKVDAEKIDMESFNAFCECLQSVLETGTRPR